MKDRFNRKINYLRISITDHCNLNCRYCSPPFSGRTHLQRSKILSYEEITALAEAAVSAGVNRIRLTGGEPLIRRGVVDLCSMLTGIKGLESLSLTTNGVNLGTLAEKLSKAGVKRVNVSLDTLRRGRFEQITGKDYLPRVLSGIEAAKAAGMAPIKINVVVMRGINDDEVADFAAMTLSKPYHVRFIELMPFQDAQCGNYEQMYVPIREVIQKIPDIDRARVDPILDNPGPARLCVLPDAKGKIGFIAPMSWHFCSSCNRLRLTANGHLKSCLFSDVEVNVKPALRRGTSKEGLKELFLEAVDNKPDRHHLNANGHNQSARGMYAIGG